MINKKDIKYIVLDLDGTLLNDDLVITEKTKKALKKVQDDGIDLVIASGRSVEGIIEYAKELGIDKHHGLIIASNGARLYDVKEDKNIFEEKLSVEDTKKVLRHLEQFELYPFILKGDDMYVDSLDKVNIDTNTHLGKINIFEWEASLGDYNLIEVDNLSDFIDFPVYKINSSGDPKYIDKHLDEFTKGIEDIVYSARTLEFSVEILKCGVSKGHALEKINAKPGEIIAFGDSMNDLEMIKYAKYGIAMKNAMDEVKENSFEITESNNDDGIYHFLNKHGFLD